MLLCRLRCRGSCGSGVSRGCGNLRLKGRWWLEERIEIVVSHCNHFSETNTFNTFQYHLYPARRVEPELTTSKPLPVSTLSVVAATLPPFRCKSQIMSRLFSWGNICDICSTCSGSTTLPGARPCAPALEPPAPLSRLKNHRITKNETTARVRSEGILIEGSSSDMMVEKKNEGSGWKISYRRKITIVSFWL